MKSSGERDGNPTPTTFAVEAVLSPDLDGPGASA
jgi:hypothetical protein